MDNKSLPKYNSVMKKYSYEIFTVLLTLLILVIFNLYRNMPKPLYKILKVQNTDEFYIDFNNNGKIDNKELVKLYDVSAFRPNKDYTTKYQMISTGLSMPETLAIGLLADEFSQKTFSGKLVQVKFIDTQSNKIPLAKIFLNDKELSQILLNEGFAINGRKENDYKKYLNYIKIDEHKKQLKNEHIFILNTSSNTVHHLDCELAQKLKKAKAIRLTEITQSQNRCNYCFSHNNGIKKQAEKNYNFKSGNLNFYFTDFNKRQKPDNSCLSEACQTLLREINNSKNTIDFAIYGIANQPHIINALVAAQKRGVKIRWVTDSDSKGNNIYPDVISAQKLLPNYKTDNHIVPPTMKKNAQYSNSIMHNKFFIFDNKKVWLGSANISHTDLADFNANIIVLANSPTIANIYSQEFEQMYNEKFHYLKKPISNKENIKIDNENTLSIYFSPVDKIIETKIIPEINSAKNYIYISSFIITHYGIKDALISAKKRGVEIKIITDATSASGKYSIHNELRNNNISVKVENKAGKMHAKSLVIDDRIIFIGSLNLTKSAENKNDENVLLIKNTKAAKIFKQHFLYLWNSIPEKWLHANPHAEGFDSYGSCSDGIDNDFDGLIDKDDSGCKFLKK